MDIEERLLIFYKAMYDIQNYFAHWKSLPDIEFDELCRKFIKKVVNARNRYEFTIIMKEFMATFKNTHTWYNDSIFWNEYGADLPFYAMYHDYEKKWVVLFSTNKELTPGTIIESIGKTKIENFYKKKKIYLSASNDNIARNALFKNPWLFPMRFDIITSNKKFIRINRSNKNISINNYTPITKIINNNIAYVSIPTFSSKKIIKDAAKYVKKFKKYKKLIIDLRNNDGGDTPIWLLKSLMNKKYRRLYYTKIVPKDALSIMTNRRIGKHMAHHYKIEKSEYKNPIKKPYTGKLVILINQATMSAAEDFVFPFKDNKRAQIIGIKTAGSNGDTYMDNYKNEVFFGIGSVVITFPSGLQFEGIGIEPDKKVYPSIKNIKDGKDVILEAAIRSLNFV